MLGTELAEGLAAWLARLNGPGDAVSGGFKDFGDVNVPDEFARTDDEDLNVFRHKLCHEVSGVPRSLSKHFAGKNRSVIAF
jgi:hypothetical protein